MRARKGWDAAQIGECGAVHPPHALGGLRAAVERHFRTVRTLGGPDTQDSGWWSSARAAAELQHAPTRADVVELRQRGG
ncbi:AP endonuclease, partial [Pseudomonas ogarae]